MPNSLEDLGLLLMSVAKVRTIHRDGIYFPGFRYMDPTLAAYVKEAVTIRYDLRDVAEICVFTGIATSAVPCVLSIAARQSP